MVCLVFSEFFEKVKILIIFTSTDKYSNSCSLTLKTSMDLMKQTKMSNKEVTLSQHKCSTQTSACCRAGEKTNLAKSQASGQSSGFVSGEAASVTFKVCHSFTNSVLKTCWVRHRTLYRVGGWGTTCN